MAPVDNLIDQLRAEVARASGTVRASPLCRLGQALLQRFSANGLHAPSALQDLNEAVAALAEGRGYLAENDTIRATASVMLGMAYGYRANYVNDGEDESAAVECLEEVLGNQHLTKPMADMARMLLGTQYVRRAMTPSALTSMMMAGLSGGPSNSALLADVERGEACFRAVLDEPSTNISAREHCQLMLDMAEAFRVMFGSSSGVLNIGSMNDFVTRLQQMQARVAATSQPGFGAYNLNDMFEISTANTQKIFHSPQATHPVMVITGDDVQDDEPAAPIMAEEEPAPGRPALRKALRERLKLAAPVWEPVGALLLPGASTPDVAVVDDAVALAATVLDTEEDCAPEDEAVDQFLLAVLLFLRHRLDSGGDGTDLHAAADALLTAARLVPPDHAAAVVIVRSLGAFLDADPRVLERVAAGLAGRFDAVLASVTDDEDRADLTALRAVCRAAWAVADAGKAVANVSSRYPWPDALRAAARTAE